MIRYSNTEIVTLLMCYGIVKTGEAVRGAAEIIGWMAIVVWLAGCADIINLRLIITLP